MNGRETVVGMERNGMNEGRIKVKKMIAEQHRIDIPQINFSKNAGHAKAAVGP